MVNIELKTIKFLNSKNSKGSSGSENYDILISTSLFMMKESYRNFSKYVNSFLKWFSYVPKNTCVRIYVDVSVLDNEDFQKIMNLKSPHLEIVQFYCEEFFDETSQQHDGTFGSIVRLLPLYEKPYNVSYVWVTDTDMPVKIFNNEIIKIMKHNNAKVFYYSIACYNKPWSKGIEYPIGAGRMIMNTKVELNKSNFTRFLNDVLKGKYHNILSEIKSKFESESSFRSFKDVKYFAYGFDELFINKYLYPIFENYKRIISFEIDLSKFLYENIVDIPKKEKFMELYSKSWRVGLDRNEFKFLKDTTQEIYDKVKDIDFKKLKNKKAQNLEICKKDYEKHSKFIKFSSFETGVSAFLIKNRKFQKSVTYKI